MLLERVADELKIAPSKRNPVPVVAPAPAPTPAEIHKSVASKVSAPVLRPYFDFNTPPVYRNGGDWGEGTADYSLSFKNFPFGIQTAYANYDNNDYTLIVWDSKSPAGSTQVTMHVNSDGSLKFVSATPYAVASTIDTLKQAAQVGSILISAGTAGGLFAGVAPVGDLSDSFDMAFDSVDYSSGEAVTAFSDAANVDYGFDIGSVEFGNASAVENGAQVDFRQAEIAEQNLGGTYESGVSDYGSVDYGFEPDGYGDFDPQVSSAGDIQKAGKAIINNKGNSSGGGRKYAGNPPRGVLTPIFSTPKSSTASQKETAVPRTTYGQLQPSMQGQSGINWMLIAGAAVVAIGMFAV